MAVRRTIRCPCPLARPPGTRRRAGGVKQPPSVRKPGRQAMGKASRTKRDGSARERIAAQRAAAKRAERRNRVFLASGAVVVVIAIVVAFVLVKANAKPKSGTSS